MRAPGIFRSLRKGMRFDPGLLLIPLLGLAAVWSFLTQPLPSTDDGAAHLLRLVQLDRCLDHGVLCLRWAPDFAHGYGYPGFNYYMNLPTLLAEGAHLLGLDFAPAIAAVTAGAFWVSGWGAYLLARDLAGRRAGLVAATAYMYAPYQFFDSAYRGNLPELWALALLPWVFWLGRRAVMDRRPRVVAWFGLLYAAFVWTHNIYVALGSAIPVAYLALLWWRQGHVWRDAARLGGMLVLGLALSAFYWLPALLETGWTRYSPGLFDYRAAFLPLSELLAWPPQIDLALLNFYPPRSLNWAMLALVLLGVVYATFHVANRPMRSLCSRIAGAPPDNLFVVTALAVTRPLKRLLRTRGRLPKRPQQPPVDPAQPGTRAAQARGDPRDTAGTAGRQPGSSTPEWLFFLALLVAASLMPLPAAAPLWAALKPLQIAQMPWRFLGFASLAGSVCAGWAIGRWERGRTLAAGLAIGLLVAAAIPWTYATPFPQPQNPGVTDILNWEYGTGLIGATSATEFLPIWASGIPDEPADPALLSGGDPIAARLDESSLPEGAQLVSAEYGILRADLVIDTPQPFRALYKQFYFPGWEVRVDGQRAPSIATAPYGLLGFDLPAGRHQVIVRPTTTPLRFTGSTLSALGLPAMAALFALDRRRARPAAAAPGRWSWRELALFAALAMALFAFKEGLIDRTQNLFRARRFDGTSLPGIVHSAQINWGDQLTLLGYDLPQRATTAGQPLRIDLYLAARRAVDGDYMAYARLVDEEGRLWSLADNGTPEGHRPPPPTSIWPLGSYGHWAYLTYTLPGTPPGRYRIEVAVFERGTWRGLNVLDELGRLAGQTVSLGPVEIVRPRTPPAIDRLDITRPLEVAAAPALRCLGSTPETETLQAGETLDITLFWQATAHPVVDTTLQLELWDGRESIQLAERLPLGRSAYPTSAWQKGETVRSPHRLRVPAAVQAGTYTLQGTVFSGSAPAGPTFSLGPITVRVTERLFTIPAGIEHPLAASLGDSVRLLGYDLPAGPFAPGEEVPVTLYWQAVREMPASYKVFVQILGPAGVLAQVDAQPGGWTRPTTGWVPGEVIVDPYSLILPADAPPGTWPLIAGMYEEQTWQRLEVLDESGQIVGDAVPLDEIVVSIDER